MRLRHSLQAILLALVAVLLLLRVSGVGTPASAVIGVGLALLAAHLLNRSFTQPLIALRERAGAIAAGDFSRRAPRNTPITELDELAAAFDRLADELSARLAELGGERDEMQALIDDDRVKRLD